MNLKRIAWAVRGVFALGIAASLAGNILHAQDNLISQAISAWSPLALLLTVELISRIPISRGWLAGARLAATAVIAGIAAWVSYGHMHAVATTYGETGAAPYLLPLSVDGLIVVASISLVEIGRRLRGTEVSVSQPVEPGIDWEREFAEMETSALPAPISPVPVSAPPAPRKSPRVSWDVSRVAEMAISGEPFSVARETGVGQSTYANISRVARLLREDPRRDLSGAGKLPSGEVVSAMRQRLVKA